MTRLNRLSAVVGTLALVLTGCGAQGASGGSTAVVPTTSGSGPAGASARDFLTATPYRSLRVTVDYMKGQAPSERALSFLEQRLGERCRKPEGVSVVLGRELSVGRRDVWTERDCRDLEAAVRTNVASGSRAAIEILFLSGVSDRDAQGTPTLGWSMSASSFAVFRETAVSLRPSGASIEDMEAAVLVHETGHLLGLVGHGAPEVRSHQDAFRPAHCTAAGCIMAAESSRWLVGPDADFDPHCRADLVAAGGQ